MENKLLIMSSIQAKRLFNYKNKRRRAKGYVFSLCQKMSMVYIGLYTSKDNNKKVFSINYKKTVDIRKMIGYNQTNVCLRKASY